MKIETGITFRKGQKCWKCKKVIKKEEWSYNGHWWCWKCKRKDTLDRIIKVVRKYE